MNATTLYCGIDVSCDTLDICYQTADNLLQHDKVANDAKGFRQLLKQTGNQYHFVMEATGVYHINLMFFLHEHTCIYSIVNALQIKRYIQMHLERNKTDKKDAKRICEYGIERKPSASEMPDPLYFESKTLNNAIKKITTQITAFTNHVYSIEKLPVYNKEVMRCYKKLIKELKQHGSTWKKNGTKIKAVATRVG
jgi:transposase